MTNNELAIVTGASRGIGKAIALRFAKENYDVMVFGRNVEALKRVQSEILKSGVQCEYFAGDAADEKFVNSSSPTIFG